MNLTIDQNTTQSTHLVRLTGEVDAFTAPKLREALLPLTEQEGAEVIVDLTDVSYMDSTGLGVFIGALKSAKKNNGNIKLTGMNKRVERLFTITGLTEVLEIDNSMRGELQ
ncbi:STAS domain-containing protein [Aureibacillus halotolerans]|uniref:Anti-sigma factor antagonist n=1 Tax=Aureibacillus halotolerans TaxID=1508390 RepID=A0A4R6TSU3_9BACI|nr:STAS domain-containing protein [Aureibacillus halotolerans]TDQ36718.1 anti-sigma B factor antagonist [Aureibacillus halotolerans]